MHSCKYFASLPESSGTLSGIMPAGAGAPGSNEVRIGPVAVEVMAQPVDRRAEPLLERVLRFPAEQAFGLRRSREQPIDLTRLGADALIFRANGKVFAE